jgi:hypothetical protein
LEVIWLATSLLLTARFELTEHEQAPAEAISPAAAPATNNVRTIERAMAPPEGESTTANRPMIACQTASDRRSR